jgi:hypothetical protein
MYEILFKFRPTPQRINEKISLKNIKNKMNEAEPPTSFPQLTNEPSPSSFASPLSTPSSFSWITIILIVLGLSLIGFNVFQYLANGTQRFDNFLGPFVKKILALFMVIFGALIHGIADTIKWIVNGFASGVDTGLTDVESIVPSPQQIKTKAAAQKSTTTTTTPASTQQQKPTTIGPVPPQSSESEIPQPVQANQGAQGVQGKTGWCYVGSDVDNQNNEFGICTQVGNQDTCMSGMIFPTQDLCINPTLRA